MKKLLYWLTGGRPMMPDPALDASLQQSGWEHYAFTDQVSGRAVFHWVDRRGRRWLAEHKWSWFRCQRVEKLEGKWPQAF